MNFQEYCQYLSKELQGTAEELYNELLFGSSKTVIVSMPSLSGKTTIMQRAGLLRQNSKILVFCPTGSLINQQLEQLSLLNGTFEAVSLAAENIGSDEELKQLLERISADEKIRFVYATPERIKLPKLPKEETATSQLIREFLEKMIEENKFTDIFCDDAYLEATEEPDIFRRNVEEFQLLRRKSPETRWIIMSNMSQIKIDRIRRDMSNYDQDNIRIIRSASYFRKDIYYEVVDGSLDREELETIQKDERKPGILFTWYKDDANVYARRLGNTIARSYHETSSNRMSIVQDWRQEKFPILVATSDSFRWGIVKKPLNFIYHSVHPKSLQFYYTESGRGLRGQTVVARLYREQATTTYSTYHERTPIRDPNITRKNPNAHYADVMDYINTQECRHKFLLERCFGEIIKPCKTSCDNCRRNEAQAEAAAQV